MVQWPWCRLFRLVNSETAVVSGAILMLSSMKLGTCSNCEGQIEEENRKHAA